MTMKSVLLLFVSLLIGPCSCQDDNSTTTIPSTGEQKYSLGLIMGGTAFWDPVREAWEGKCPTLEGVTCHIKKQERGKCDEVIETSFMPFFIDLIYTKKVNAIVFPPCSTDVTMFLPLLDMAKAEGVHVITFDNDFTEPSYRSANVGTDNTFLGRTMARLLRQLRPEGGTFSIIAPAEERYVGFESEITKYNEDDRGDRAHWYEVGGANFSVAGSDNYMRQMHEYAELNPSAMIFMKQTPMRHPNWTHFVETHRHRNITLIGTDGSDYQLDYLHGRYVDGLVGQLPYEWGSVTLDVLYDLVQGKTLTKDFFGTNVVAYNLIPLELPQLELDHNLLGNLVYVGHACIIVTFIMTIACVGWTYKNRTSFVVRAAQPFFLYMIAGGVFLMSMTHIPMGFDDDGYPEGMSLSEAEGICMSIPWLSVLGFTVTFSALFSKTWRVNRLFHAKVSHARIQVTEKDVLAPFALMVTCNIVILICWTVIDPLVYVRQERDGTDYWNRVIAAYGSCRSEDVKPYLIPLALLNFVLVAVACWQAFQARDITSEFSESFYIGLTVFSLFQAFLTGLPILVIVKDMPEAFYLVLTLMIFILCVAVLLLIFLPKVLMLRRYSGMSAADQKKRLKTSIKTSSAPLKHLSGSGSGYQGSYSHGSGAMGASGSMGEYFGAGSSASWNNPAVHASRALNVGSAFKSSITQPSMAEDSVEGFIPVETESTKEESSTTFNLKPIGEVTNENTTNSNTGHARIDAALAQQQRRNSEAEMIEPSDELTMGIIPQQEEEKQEQQGSGVVVKEEETQIEEIAFAPPADSPPGEAPYSAGKETTTTTTTEAAYSAGKETTTATSEASEKETTTSVAEEAATSTPTNNKEEEEKAEEELSKTTPVYVSVPPQHEESMHSQDTEFSS